MGNGIYSSVQSSTSYLPGDVAGAPATWLLGGIKWGGAVGTGVNLTYSFIGADSYYSATFYGDGSELDYASEMSAAQMADAKAAMQSFANVAAIGFTEVIDSETVAGDIRWANSTQDTTSYAWAYYPGSNGRSGDVWVNPDKQVSRSGEQYYVFAHELGHALGLSHPHQEDGRITAPAPSERDQNKYTVMSYCDYAGDPISANESDYYPTTLMIDDIRAIQAIYGKNLQYRAENTIYQWSADAVIYETIWDGGGIDKIDASNQLAGVSINLNPGTFSTIGKAFFNGQSSVRDCLGIAYDCNIENATGSAFNDTLLGNSLANVLVGGGGADTLSGGAGNDSYHVDNAGDRVTESADSVSGGIDTVNSSVSFTLGSYVEKLVLTGSGAINGTGNGLNNSLSGNGAANVLNGGGGADTMLGGGGNDSYHVDNAGDRVSESADSVSGGIDTVNASVSFTLGNYVEKLVLSGTGAINGTGNGLDNSLSGNGAANVLDGGLGADTMSGGTGSDSYYVDNVGDRVTESADSVSGGIDTVNSSVSFTLGSYVEKLLLSGTGAINGTGNGLNNTLSGNGAANVLYGGPGADTMSGGLGNDSYHVDNAGDLVIESADSVSGGSDTVNANFTYTLGSYVERLVLTGTGAINGTGNGLNNVLTGNAGSNVLSGGAGNDIFIFKTALNATSNVDTLADFSKASGNTDRIHLDDDVFTAFGSVTQSVLLSAEAFCLGTKATTDSHRIVYDAQAGALYYDADGVQTGFAAVKFALLGTSTHPALTASDFTIVS